jgi:hypothetical protein
VCGSVRRRSTSAGREPKFPDPDLTDDQDHRAFTFPYPSPAPKQQFRFFLPPDEAGQFGRVQGLETALD